jgi:hypothetical protein
MIRSREKVPDGFTIRSPWRRIFNGGRALDILRSFEGLIGDKAYIEVLQRFIQIFDLHLVPERNAWCRLDKHGDIEEVIRSVRVPEKGPISDSRPPT